MPTIKSKKRAGERCLKKGCTCCDPKNPNDGCKGRLVAQPGNLVTCDCCGLTYEQADPVR
jgi:hypothetical protein